MNTKKINILAITNDTASRKWRFDGIAKRINERTKESGMFVTSHKAWNENIVGADVVVLEMVTNPRSVDLIHKAGAKAIYEADDAVMDAYGEERANLMEITEQHKKDTLETIKKCDAVTVTNKYLQEHYKQFTDKPIYVLPNYVDLDWYGDKNIETKRNSGEIRIGWFGSRGHLEDLKMVTPALEKVIAKYPNVKFVYCGFGGMSSDRLVTEVGWGEDVFKDIPRNRREFVIAVQEEYWPLKHRHLDLDIGICPLIDDYFNHNKSHIKWMEYGLLGTPAVCSPTVYAEHPIKRGSVVQHGKTGFIARTEEDWVMYLSQLVEDAKLRRRMGQAARRKVLKSWDLEKHWTDWLDIYHKVVNNK